MYLMVVVVAAVDAVDNVSLTQSGTISRCAYGCAEQKITRGGSWDVLPEHAACPLIFPRLFRLKISVFHKVFPTCVVSIIDRLEGCDQRQPQALSGWNDQALVITNTLGSLSDQRLAA
jgi:hypothetical protein